MREIRFSKILAIIAITMFTIGSSASGQIKELDIKNINSLAGWHKAPFSGEIDGRKAYDLYYNESVIQADGFLSLETIAVFTDYGQEEAVKMNLSSDTIRLKAVWTNTIINLYGGAVISALEIINVYDNDKSAYKNYDEAQMKWFKPFPGSTGDKLIKLALETWRKNKNKIKHI